MIGSSENSAGSGWRHRRRWWYLSRRDPEQDHTGTAAGRESKHQEAYKTEHTATSADSNTGVLQTFTDPDNSACSVAETPDNSLTQASSPSFSAPDRYSSPSPSVSSEVSLLRFLLGLLIANYCFTEVFGSFVGKKLLTAVLMLAGRPRWLSGPRGLGAGKGSRSSLKAPRLAHIMVTVIFIIIIFGFLTKIFSLILSASSDSWSADIPTVLRTWNLDPSILYRTEYQTSHTRDIHPRPVHSHNDYWRQIPLFTALTVGAVGVEADVWRYDDELYVGHDAPSLTRNRTFRTLYIDPIRKLLDEMNQPGEIPIAGVSGVGERKIRGVYDSAPEQTLNLYVDLKTPGPETLPVVISHLAPLRSPVNYLTHFNGTHTNYGPVTVHLTGDTPFDLLLSSNTTYRDYFFDAPVTDLDSGKYNTTNTLMSSTPFSKNVGRVMWGSGGVSDGMLKTIRKHVKSAHDRGIGIRYWSTPGWPIGLRNKVWKTLVKEGVDLLNADDLKAAVMLEW